MTDLCRLLEPMISGSFVYIYIYICRKCYIQICYCRQVGLPEGEICIRAQVPAHCTSKMSANTSYAIAQRWCRAIAVWKGTSCHVGRKTSCHVTQARKRHININFFVRLALGLVAPYRAILRYYRCDTPYRAILFKGGQHSPKMVRYPPLVHLVSHRHICAIPHFATYRAIIVRYPTKTSTK